MQNVISGRLCGIDENEMRIQLPNGLIQGYPYNGIGDAGLDIDIQWLFDNMGQSVVCLVKDKMITDVKPIGKRL